MPVLSGRQRFRYDLMATKFFALGWFRFFFFFFLWLLIVFGVIFWLVGQLISFFLFGSFLFLLQVELCELDQIKIQTCYRIWFLAEIIATDSSISQCPLGKPNWLLNTFKKLEKRIKTQTLMINTGRKERLTVVNGKPFPFKYR